MKALIRMKWSLSSVRNIMRPELIMIRSAIIFLKSSVTRKGRFSEPRRCPYFCLSQLVRENDIKVVITGEASDEILFGYDSYKELKLLQFWARSPQSAIRPLLIKRLYPHLRHYADTKAYGLMKLYYEDFLDTFSNPLVGLNIRIRNNTVLAAALNKELGVKFNQDDLIDKITATFPADYERLDASTAKPVSGNDHPAGWIPAVVAGRSHVAGARH